MPTKTTASSTETTDAGVIVHAIDPTKVEQAQQRIDQTRQRMHDLEELEVSNEERLQSDDLDQVVLARLVAEEIASRQGRLQKAIEGFRKSLSELGQIKNDTAILAADTLADYLREIYGADLEVHAAGGDAPKLDAVPRVLVLEREQTQFNSAGVLLSVTLTAPRHYAPLDPAGVQGVLANADFAFAQINRGTRETHRAVESSSVEGGLVTSTVGFPGGVLFDEKMTKEKADREARRKAAIIAADGDRALLKAIAEGEF